MNMEMAKQFVPKDKNDLKQKIQLAKMTGQVEKAADTIDDKFGEGKGDKFKDGVDFVEDKLKTKEEKEAENKLNAMGLGGIPGAGGALAGLSGKIPGAGALLGGGAKKEEKDEGGLGGMMGSLGGLGGFMKKAPRDAAQAKKWLANAQ